METPLWSGAGPGVACMCLGVVASRVPRVGSTTLGPSQQSRGPGFPTISKIQAPKQHPEKLLVLSVSSPVGQALRMLPRPFLGQEKAVQQLKNFPDAFYLFCFIFEQPNAGGLGLTVQSWQEQHILLRESCFSATSIYCHSAVLRGNLPQKPHLVPQGGP